MKAPTLHSFLEDCRAAKTSEEIGAAGERIESRIGTMQADRRKLDGQLGEAIVAGRDQGKIYAAIAQIDEEVKTLEIARVAFSEKQENVRKAEEAREIQALLDKQAQLTGALEAAARDFAKNVEAARVSGELMVSIEKQHSRNRDQFEGLKQRPGKPASGIIRETIGDIRRGDGVTEYGRRIDIGFAEILADNPSVMRRAQVLRRGRVGESNQARDMATEGWMTLARAK